MTEQSTQTAGQRKLSHEILGILGISFAIALFLFAFLSLTAQTIADRYCDYNNLSLTYAQSTGLEMWIFGVSLITSVLFFTVLFLFLLGQKLSAAEKQIRRQEQALQEEREQLIRSLSHDIRTPLTSILSYSELLLSQIPPVQQRGGQQREDGSTLVWEDCRERLSLIQKKAEQIKDLTDVLLDGGKRQPAHFEDARLLMEQLASEVEEELEDDFDITIDLHRCAPFRGTFDVRELQRIFDNLVSNIRKYADPERPVLLSIDTGEKGLAIRQENNRTGSAAPAESCQIGLASIRRIAHHYGGTVEVRQGDDYFSITITLTDF